MNQLVHRKLISLIRAKAAFSLVELLIAIFLCAILGSVSYQVLQTSVQLHVKIRTSYQRNYQKLRIYNFIKQALTDLDQHPLLLAPIVFKKGVLVDTENLPLTISSDHTKSPSSNSDALAYLKLDLNSALRLRLNQLGQVETCQKLPVNSTKAIGLDLAGLAYYQVKIISKDQNCFQLELIENRNIFLPLRQTTHQIIPDLIIPIQHEYLIYKDNQQRLRYVTLTGLEILQNQPIVEVAPDLNFSAQLTARIWEINVSLFFAQQVLHRHFVSQVRRHHHGNYNLYL